MVWQETINIKFKLSFFEKCSSLLTIKQVNIIKCVWNQYSYNYLLFFWAYNYSEQKFINYNGRQGLRIAQYAPQLKNYNDDKRHNIVQYTWIIKRMLSTLTS